MHVSFRNRLTFFFVLLVILPVLALALVGILIVRDSEETRSSARLEQAQKAGDGLYTAARDRAQAVAERVAGDSRISTAIRDRDRAAQRRRLEELARRAGAAIRVDVPGAVPVEAGALRDPVAPARSRIVDPAGRPAGAMTVSVTEADDFAGLVERVTGLRVIVARGDEILSGMVAGGSARGMPLEGRAEIEGAAYRVTGFTAPGFDGGPVGVRVLARESELQNAVSENSLGLVLILLAFLVCALAFALTAVRSLKAQVDRLLEAARRLGAGEFSVEVPTEGKDEFAALGTEFNSMARELEGRLDELQLERGRLQETVRRVGESLGKNLDRDALLGVVVQTAVDGVGADCGRVVLRQTGNGALSEAARAGNVSSHLAAVQAAESAVLDAGEAAETQVAGANALARPLHASTPDRAVVGVISIARPGRSFTGSQRELFAYLTSQAAISIENVDLHEAVQRQAVTDELTGLYNHRHFQEVMTAEVERTRRFHQELGLIMLDIDNFKRVNDTYGHMQGDVVLRGVARVVRESSREIDEPARYGGEEMAVALPQTGLQGAYEFAERVRQRIERLEFELLQGPGTLRVTASFGVASLPHSAKVDKDALFAAADAALYRAKRSGKNRTVKAE